MIKTPNPKPHIPYPGSAGFTLVEVLVSLLIFSIALTAIFYLLTNNLKNASLVKNNFIASGLVQEGIEVVRNIRDSDWHAGSLFGTSIPDGNYRVQWSSTSLLPFSGDPCPAPPQGGLSSCLKKDSGNGLVSYDTGNDMIFKRTITISTVSSVEKMVVVSVTWDERGILKSVNAEDHLFDWK